MIMAETPYPYYDLSASGPAETGFFLRIQITDGAGGPLAGLTDLDVLHHLRDWLDSQDNTTVTLARSEVVYTGGL
jgi:hypothetical protein